jgi:hypothetical protein
MHMEITRYADLLRIKFEFPGFLEYFLKVIPFVFVRNKKVQHSSLKYSWQYQRFRTDVFRIHDYRCIKCGSRFGKKRLTVHHLFSPLRDHLDVALDPDFSVCCCINCHNKFHKLFGWSENTPEQFNKFLKMKFL